MKWVLLVLCVVLIVVHQDLWNWDRVDPRVLGFVPVGLWYQAVFTVAASLFMSLLVKWVWPTHLESAEPETPEAREGERAQLH